VRSDPAIEVVGEARDGVEAVQRIEALKPDLVFLDIELPGLTGFEVLEAIPASAAMPLVIFVTGYDEHALAAFEANALAYLLKPVEPQRLAKAVERASKLTGESERRHLLRVARETPKTLRQVVCRKRDRVLLMTPVTELAKAAPPIPWARNISPMLMPLSRLGSAISIDVAIAAYLMTRPHGICPWRS